MKRILIPAAALLLAASCNNSNGPANPPPTDSTTPPTATGPVFVPLDTANRMIQSYLNGINYTVNTGEIKAVIVNADTLRNYLSNTNIKSVKLIFAHNLDYINSGHYGQRPDTNSNATTIIIAGFGTDGNYIYKNSQVMDHAVPCPTYCPSSGTAANNLLLP